VDFMGESGSVGISGLQVVISSDRQGWRQFTANLPKWHVPGVLPGWRLAHPKSFRNRKRGVGGGWHVLSALSAMSDEV